MHSDMRVTALMFVALVMVSILVTPAVAKSCKNGLCVSSEQKGDQLFITITSTSSPYTHFNFLDHQTGQQEEYPGHARAGGALVVRNRVSNFVKYGYAVQVCNKDYQIQRSSCRPWAEFFHTITH